MLIYLPYFNFYYLLHGNEKVFFPEWLHSSSSDGLQVMNVFKDIDVRLLCHKPETTD